MSEAPHADWPAVVLRGNSFRTLGIRESDVAALARALIRELFDEELPLVQRLVVADYAQYGDAIRDELDRDVEQTHTDRHQYKGVAIAIPTHAEHGLDQTVVIGAGAVAAAMGYEGVVPIMPAYFGRYLLQHEFAHCFDHLARGLPAPTDEVSDGSWLRQVHVRFRRMVLAEFSACRIGGRALTEEAFVHLCGLDADPLEEEIQRIMQLREQYRTRQRTDLSTVAGEACQCVWLAVVHHAKLFGHMIGAGRSSASVQTPSVLASRPEAMAAIEDLSGLLGTKAGDYPDWPDDGWEELDGVWSRLAGALGFRFEETAAGPALWFE